MKTSTKYAATAALYDAGEEGVWEHELFERLQGVYPPGQLMGLRDQLVGLANVGWVEVLDEREAQGRLLRKYALYPSMRPFVEYQLSPALLADPSLKAPKRPRAEAPAPVRGTPRAESELSRKMNARRTRVGMIYAIAAAPAFGLAFGLLGRILGHEPFTLEAPTGGFAEVALLQAPFTLATVTVYLIVSGTWREIFRTPGHRVSWWTLFTGAAGLLGDLSNAVALGLIGGALGGAVGGLTGVVGAVLASILYREKITRWSTLIGLATMGVGIFLAMSGGSITAPTHGVYLVVGVIVMVCALLSWGFETFAISAGSDLITPEGFMWWRELLEVVLANILLWLLFPKGREMAAGIWSDPRIVAYGAVIGLGVGIWVVMGYFIGVAYAGAVRGGVLTNTLAFFFLSVFSLTVYGLPFSAAIIIGGVIMAIGTLLIVTEPTKYIARLRG